MLRSSRSAFTLIELLVVIAVIAILTVVVILVLNPSQLLKQSRDANRLSDAATIKTAVSAYEEDTNGSLGSPGVVYISIPDPSATSSAGDQCQGLGLPTLPGSSTYQCASSSTYHLVNGTGWIPINFKNISFGSPISSLPVDPINTSSSGEFYTYMASSTTYETTMALESTKYATTEASDGGQYTDLYEQGTNLTLAPMDFYASVIAGGGPYSGYVHERAITVSANASGTNTNFPMLFSGTYSWLEASSSGGRIQNLVTAPNGGQEPADLIFGTSSGCSSPLNFETESYTSSTGAIIDWVNVPSLSAGTVIYACYENVAVTTDQSHPSSTWNTNYAGVWHFASPTSTLQANDSTANNNNGTVVGPTVTSGEIGTAALFSSNYIKIPASASLEPTSAITMSAWVNVSTYRNAEKILAFPWTDPLVSAPYVSYCLNTGDDSFSNRSSMGITTNGSSLVQDPGQGSLSTGVWMYITGVYNGSAMQMYYNGSAVGSATSLSGTIKYNSPTNLIIGMNDTHNSFSQYMSGSIEEVHIASTALSPSWILTEYNNQSSPSAFYSVGSEL